MAGLIKTLKIVDGGSGTDAWQFSVLCKGNKQLMMQILLGSHNIYNQPAVSFTFFVNNLVKLCVTSLKVLFVRSILWARCFPTHSTPRSLC